jgi:hypothetical protein
MASTKLNMSNWDSRATPDLRAFLRFSRVHARQAAVSSMKISRFKSSVGCSFRKGIMGGGDIVPALLGGMDALFLKAA